MLTIKKMKKIILVLTTITCFAFYGNSQEVASAEKYGKTLNLGIGVGYYGYVGHSMPVVHADFEFDVAKNFTLIKTIITGEVILIILTEITTIIKQ